MKGRAVIRSLMLLLLPAGCVTPYYPPSGSGQGGNIVVDGFINATKNSALINLSRSIQLSDYHPSPAETGANVTITTNNGVEYKLKETSDGIYEGTNLSLDPLARYKLHISTQSGQSFSSNEVDLLPVPALDSVSWAPSNEGVTWYVNAHGSETSTRYYKWTFDETFEYNVLYFSDFKKVNKLPVFRDPSEWVYMCYATQPSTNVLIGTTKNLAQDVVSLFPIYFVPKGSVKFSHHYRMTVTQVAITQDEYEFWEQIKKSTETLGGLFDPIPGKVLGNIHNDNDDNDVVLGYFSGGFVEEKLKYLSFQDLPVDLGVVDRPEFDCQGRALYLDQLDQIKPEEVYVNQFGTPLMGYFVANEKCADCRSIFAGTNVKPDDWPIF